MCINNASGVRVHLSILIIWMETHILCKVFSTEVISVTLMNFSTFATTTDAFNIYYFNTVRKRKFESPSQNEIRLAKSFYGIPGLTRQHRMGCNIRLFPGNKREKTQSTSFDGPGKDNIASVRNNFAAHKRVFFKIHAQRFIQTSLLWKYCQLNGHKSAGEKIGPHFNTNGYVHTFCKLVKEN